ncbi:hypothetical protein DICVIV_05825, partial [Dictyocaulus viviparus]
VTLLFTILCSVKIVFTPQQDDIQTDSRYKFNFALGYTPYGARSRKELAVYNEYFASRGEPITIYAFVLAKDDGSMTRLPYLHEAIEQLDFVSSNITYDGQSFSTLCTDFCQINEPTRQFYNGLVMKVNSTEIDDRISTTFPIMEVLGKELDLSPSLFGVRTNNTDGTIQYLKMIVYQFRANPPTNWSRFDVQTYERRMSTYFHSEMKSDLLKVYCLSLTFVSDEIVRTGLSIFPCLAVGFSIMSLFSVVTIYYSSTRMGQVSCRLVKFYAIFFFFCINNKSLLINKSIITEPSRCLL